MKDQPIIATGAGPQWLGAVRQQALERFRKEGFPTPKVEAWKFTNLSPLAGITFREPAPRAEVTRADIEPYRLTPTCHLLVFVNGHYRADLSSLERVPEGSRIVDLSAASEDDFRGLTAPPAVDEEAKARSLFDLNTASMRGGAVLHLGRGAVLDPVQLLFVASPAGGEPEAVHVRNLIRAEPGSSAVVFETYVALGKGAYWTNVVTQIDIAANAMLRHYKLQAESPAAFHVAATSVRLGRQAGYKMVATSLGAELARNEIDVNIAEPDGEAHLRGATLGRSSQHLDTTVRIDHNSTGGGSLQEFKNVVDEAAHVVFQGRIQVAPGAQKTDAQQVSRSLLLSKTANADAKPELIILADDVKCSHGATIGDLDEESLFYLRARGIGEEEGRKMLIDAFIGELINRVSVDAVRSYFHRAVDRWFADGGRK